MVIKQQLQVTNFSANLMKSKQETLCNYQHRSGRTDKGRYIFSKFLSKIWLSTCA